MSYTKEDFYKSTLEKAIGDIQARCFNEGIPCFMTFAIADDDNKTTYRTEVVSPAAAGRELSDDHIYRHMSILSGFSTVPPQSLMPGVTEYVEELEGGKVESVDSQLPDDILSVEVPAEGEASAEDAPAAKPKKSTKAKEKPEKEVKKTTRKKKAPEKAEKEEADDE